jgi:uncharacterized protein with FMN-binding domain
MKKIFLSTFVILVFIFYSVYHQQQTAQIKTPTDTINPTDSPTSTPIPVSNSQPLIPTDTPTPTTAPKTVGQYKDGEYTGEVADAYYGNLQVKAIIQAGKIVDVQFLQYPNDRRRSIEINTEAMPYLKSEAIQAQSANVDVVSGATASSEGFVQSLKSALQQARS